MDAVTGINALKRTIELVLQKLNMVQDEMNELSREELIEIMGNNDLDLSWIASQESVNNIRDELNNMKLEVMKLNNQIVLNKNAVVADLAYFNYVISSGYLLVSGFKSININDDSDIVLYGGYTVNNASYPTSIGSTSGDYTGHFSTICNSYTICPGVALYRNHDLYDIIPTYVKHVKIIGSVETSSYKITGIGAPPMGKNLVTLDLGNMSLSKVNDMSECFRNLAKLESVKMTNLSCSSKTSMARMFAGCTNLKEVLVSHTTWDKLPASCDTTDMFKDCGVDHVTYVD